MKILAVETSCDETAVSILEADEKTESFKILSNVVSSQVKIHAEWGGVVPNLAAREHLKNIIPVLDKALKKSQTELSQIDLISVTQGPGLIPALLLGVNAAKTLAYFCDKTLVGIHHIEGHIYSNYIEKEGGELKHISFLSEETSDPRLNFMQSLKDNLGEAGDIMVYNQTTVEIDRNVWEIDESTTWYFEVQSGRIREYGTAFFHNTTNPNQNTVFFV